MPGETVALKPDGGQGELSELAAALDVQQMAKTLINKPIDINCDHDLRERGEAAVLFELLADLEAPDPD